MKKTNEQDIHDAVVEFRDKHPEKLDEAIESLTRIIAILLKHDTASRSRLIHTVAIFFDVNIYEP